MTQNKRFKKIHEILEKNAKYGYYYDNKCVSMPPRCGKSAFQQGLNCSDEIVPGSNERASKIRQLMHKKIEIPSENFTEKYSEIMHELRDLMKEEYMALTDCSEREAGHFLDMLVDFNHVKYVCTDGRQYLSIDPKIKSKYGVIKMTERDIDCSTCKYHSYDWYTEGPNAYDEFEVCLKGNFLHDGECKDYEIFEDYLED